MTRLFHWNQGFPAVCLSLQCMVLLINTTIVVAILHALVSVFFFLTVQSADFTVKTSIIDRPGNTSRVIARFLCFPLEILKNLPFNKRSVIKKLMIEAVETSFRAISEEQIIWCCRSRIIRKQASVFACSSFLRFPGWVGSFSPQSLAQVTYRTWLSLASGKIILLIRHKHFELFTKKYWWVLDRYRKYSSPWH